MSGFGGGNKIKNKNKKKQSPSAGKGKKVQNKVHRIDESKLKERSEATIKPSMNINVANEIIDLPVYCSVPNGDKETDLFIAHVMGQSKKEVFKPIFMGQYTTKSFDMNIKSSSMSLSPKDLIENTSDDVVNLSRK